LRRLRDLPPELLRRGQGSDGRRRAAGRDTPAQLRPELHHFLTVSSFAEYAVVPESGAVALPESMPLDLAALLSCAVLTGFGAVHNTARVAAGSRVAVYGCGGVGLNIVQGARLAGAARIIAIDVSDDKLELARRLGATNTVNARADNPVAAVHEAFDDLRSDRGARSVLVFDR
jgi:S-(hydroxymethyl)glutathione dehydrogenase / alcohol dehydrogenase